MVFLIFMPLYPDSARRYHVYFIRYYDTPRMRAVTIPHRQPKDHPRSRRVSILIDTATSWGRDIIRGIHRYARGGRGWEILLEARGADELISEFPLPECDGLIARIASPCLRRTLEGKGLPVVNVSGTSMESTSFPRICTDLEAGARMAAEYFREKGFVNHGYFGGSDLPFVRSHQKAFAKEVERLGGNCAAHGSYEGMHPLGEWLADAPKPLALLTWNASGAQTALKACQENSLTVPGDVSILSGTDDDLLCEVTHVPISGIQVSGEEIGFKSARLLDCLMAGAKPPARPEFLSPVRIVERLSTQILAIGDPRLVKALEFIRRKAFGPIGVEEISRHSGISRRMLERRFASLLNRSPAEQIRHVRISKAEELLIETNLSIPEVAEASGFGSPEYLAYVFRGAGRVSPLQYRKRYRL